jgi:hypothetical protein
VNAVFDKDYVAGVTSAGGLLVDAIEAHCGKGDGVCFVSTKSSQVKKGIAILNGFVSYASTYDETQDPKDASAAEREKVRHDERKKAMEELIASTTERSGRGGDWVVSAGVGVGLNAGRTPRTLSVSDAFWSPTLSLPLGVAVQYLPKNVVGFHAQLTLLDIGQYANINANADVAKADVATAAVVGTEVGLLLGGAKYNALLGFDFGYAPGLRFSDGDSPGIWRLGAFAGTYVPFFDFN